jgi:hypothetical protein
VARQPGLQRLTRNHRQAQHHQPAQLAHQMALVQEQAGQIAFDRGAAGKDQRARRAFLPAHQGHFQPQHGRQDHQQQQAVAEQLGMNVMHRDGMAHQGRGKLVGKHARQERGGSGQNSQIGYQPGDHRQPLTHSFGNALSQFGTGRQGKAEIGGSLFHWATL